MRKKKGRINGILFELCCDLKTVKIQTLLRQHFCSDRTIKLPKKHQQTDVYFDSFSSAEILIAAAVRRLWRCSFSPLGKDLRELQRAVGYRWDEVEGRGPQVGALDELVQTLQQIVYDSWGVTRYQHVASCPDRHGYRSTQMRQGRSLSK